jgi:hypothetical protein
MTTRILSAAAAGILFLGLTAQSTSAHSWGASNHRELVTFSAPIALPGVVLAAGTYAFEEPDAAISGLVRVTSPNSRQVYLTQYTRIVNRRNADTALRVTFSEAAPGGARPVNTWFPRGEDQGRQFIYK